MESSGIKGKKGNYETKIRVRKKLGTREQKEN